MILQIFGAPFELEHHLLVQYFYGYYECSLCTSSLVVIVMYVFSCKSSSLLINRSGFSVNLTTDNNLYGSVKIGC